MIFFRKLFYKLSPSMRLWVRRCAFFPLDTWEFLIGKRHPLQPPRGLIYTGGGDFIAIGKQYLRYFIEWGGLKPHHTVLDVGSGIGRMAVPLTSYLNEHGEYNGFDVVELGVNWCKSHISPLYPNFHFQYVPLENDLYTADGKKATSFVFPYPDNSFDFIFLTSVFTHMLPEECFHYLAEIQRVMKPQGKCLATFFIISDESLAAMNQYKKFVFPFQKQRYWLMDEHVQSANVALDWDFLQENIAANGLNLHASYWGTWSGRDDAHDFQDVLVLQKNP